MPATARETPGGPATRVAPVKGGDGDYDLAVIGAGSAAFAGAIRARDLGARVVMIEQGIVGGTCVNVGCVPSKALLRAADMYHAAGHHPFAGIDTAAGPVDVRALVSQKDELVAEMRKDRYEDLLAVHGIELVRGTARFVDERALEVDGRPLRAAAYLVATGAAPAVPPLPGLAEAGYLTSTTALGVDTVPGSLAGVGANAVGLELGQLFGHLGSQVTLFDVLDRVAPFTTTSRTPAAMSSSRRAAKARRCRVQMGCRRTGGTAGAPPCPGSELEPPLRRESAVHVWRQCRLVGIWA